MIGLFLTFRKLTALLCHVCSFLFHSGVADWSSSALQELFALARQHIYIHLVFSADWTEAKTLSQAHIHWFEIRCELQVSQEYLTSTPQGSIYRLELSVWVIPQTERVIALLLSLISRQHGNNNRTVNNTGQGSAVTTILSKPRIIFHVCEEGDFGIWYLRCFT